MTIDPDDPRLTAFALGELEGPERDQIDALVAANPDLQRFVDETRLLARSLTEQLRTEPAPSLTADQRRRIEQQARTGVLSATPASVIPFLPSGRRWLRHAFAAAALLAVGFGTYTLWPSRHTAKFAATDNAVGSPAIKQFSLEKATATNDRAAGRVDSHDLALTLPDEPRAIGDETLPRATTIADLEAVAPQMAETSESIAQLATSPDPSAPPALLAKQQVLQAAPSPSPTSLASRPGEAPPVGLSLEASQSPNSAQFDFIAPPQPAEGAGGYATMPASSRMRGAAIADSDAADHPREFLARGGAVFDTPDNNQNAPAPAAVESPTMLGDISSQPDRAKKPGQLAHEGDQLARLTPGQAADRLAPESRDANAIDLRRHSLKESARKLNDRLAEGAQPAAPGLPAAVAPSPAVESKVQAEQYAPIVENDFVAVVPQNTLATFSTDVDTGSYSNVRRMLTQNTWPRRDAVRIEELINYFPYSYPEPPAVSEAPFSVNTELTTCPWNSEHSLLRVGLRGRSIEFANRAPTNLVFLVDVSGSMNEPNKLPLVKAGLRMLTEQLGENDTITLVTYAGNSELTLSPTSGDNQAEIASAIDQLQPGGSTNGAGGINLAYSLATQHFLKNGVNRVILATDGDFNVGVNSVDELIRLAEEKARTGVFLSVLGVGEANLKDQNLEQIADKGNGQYSYIDNLLEARKVLVDQAGGTLLTIAKDVKIQVDFNPAKVGAYRLIGYENRALRAQDFRDDTKDAGEIGSGHTVTALFELIPPDAQAAVALRGQIEPSHYAKSEVVVTAQRNDEFLNVALRFKAPDADTSRELNVPVNGPVTPFGEASDDTRFASAVALFGMILRESKYKGSGTLDAVLELAQPASTPDNDPGRYRREFLELVAKAKSLQPESRPVTEAPAP